MDAVADFTRNGEQVEAKAFDLEAWIGLLRVRNREARALLDEAVAEELITLEHAYSHKRLRFVVHLCRWRSGEPQPLASQQVRWVAPAELPDYPFPAANARIIAALHAVFTVRTAQGAIAWAMSLLFIPYFTLIPYLVFGSRTFDAYIKARRQANREMHVAMADLNWRPWVEEALAARNSESYAALRAMPKLGRMPCLANNQVSLLIDGQATFDAIFKAIEGATDTVLIQFFIIHDDTLGKALQQLLLRKAAEGVQVFVLYDRVGSHALPATTILWGDAQAPILLPSGRLLK